MMKKYTTAIRGAVCALTVLIGCQGAGAAAPESALQMRSISVERNADRMEIEFTIIPRDLRVDRDREVVFTPVIVSHDGDSTLELPVVKVSGRNRYYSHIRNGVAQGTKVYLAGSKEPIEYRAVVPYASWMERGRVDMLEATAHCCDAPVPAPTTPLARFDFVKEPLEPQFNYVDLTGDETIELTAEGRAFLDFVVNRTDIRPTYRENTREIAKIIETINLVKDDPDATITKVTFKGYASPEGPWDNNVRLAMGRTAALKEYVRQRYNFDPEIMSSDYEPEDWEGLRRWLLECDLPHRTEILQIVDSDLAPDPKDHEIRRRYPEEYAVILRDVYPALRHSDYTVKYAIRTYIDIEELKAVFASDPRRLRPVDFNRIADLYRDKDFDRYAEVMMKAAEIHPDDQQVNLNAANIAMQKGDLDSAAAYVAKAGDSPEATYTRGVLAALRGDEGRAEECFRLAASQGMQKAQDELDSLAELRSRPTVEYLIELKE